MKKTQTLKELSTVLLDMSNTLHQFNSLISKLNKRLNKDINCDNCGAVITHGYIYLDGYYCNDCTADLFNSDLISNLKKF